MRFLFFGILGTIFTVIAYIPYGVYTFKSTIQPSPITWFVISFIGFVTVLSYKEVGAFETLGLAIVNFLGPIIIFILTLVHPNKKAWRNKDFKFLVFSFFAILIWLLTKSPVLALFFNLFADFLGFLPTIKKSWHKPYSEDLLSWSLFVIGGLFNFLAIKDFNFAIIVYPLYIVGAEGLVLTFLIIRRSKVQRNKE